MASILSRPQCVLTNIFEVEATYWVLPQPRGNISQLVDRFQLQMACGLAPRRPLCFPWLPWEWDKHCFFFFIFMWFSALGAHRNTHTHTHTHTVVYISLTDPHPTPFRRFIPEKLPLFIDFANSRLSLKNYPFLRESGYERGTRFDRELNWINVPQMITVNWGFVHIGLNVCVHHEA